MWTAASGGAVHAERLAKLGITVGCSAEPARYCPDDPVTRAQMASFLERAFNLDQAAPAGVHRYRRQLPRRRDRCSARCRNHQGLLG